MKANLHDKLEVSLVYSKRGTEAELLQKSKCRRRGLASSSVWFVLAVPDKLQMAAHPLR